LQHKKSALDFIRKKAIVSLLICYFCMLHFSRLTHLHTHLTTIQEIIPGQDIFVVGGALRDLLLGISEHITDVDLTGAGTPEQWRETMHLPETGRSRFRTEKF
jgi:hypothetical protein